MHQRDLAEEFPGPQRFIDVIHHVVGEHADREMLVTPTSRMTYAEADDRSRTMAKQFLARGGGKGTRIAAHLPHGPEWVVSFLAATRIGALFMPFSAAYKPAELRRALLLGDVDLLLATTESWHGGSYAGFLEQAVPELAGVEPVGGPGSLRCAAVPLLRDVWLFGEGVVPSFAAHASLGGDGTETGVSDELLDAVEARVCPADDALIIWTSGTTADPKGAVHTQATLARRAKANAYSHGYVTRDRIFCDYAFWWVGGPGYGLLPAMWAGATTLVVPRHDRASTEAFLARERPTRIAGKVAPDIVDRFVAVGEGSEQMMSMLALGMTETFGPHSMHEQVSVADFQATPRSGLGPAIVGFERRIVDPETGREVAEGTEGELLVRGPGMMRGLYRRERDEVFDPDGWYHTGDKCVIRDGLVYFVSRISEMIKTSGSNVAPLEVELVVLALPEVQEAVVFGMPDEQRGQRVVAVVVPAPGATVEETVVRDHVRSELSNYKVPRHVLVVPEAEMPRLHSGKPDKLALRERFAAHLAEMAVAT